ncbi:MAG: hypothetical protein DRQ61_02960 [Gammaproteobacteria bacterium]|nr:MAG: hypothetical protein DRQ56_02735 [Gammaproteobacteria bacterium]RLA23756.1 MAG: hypothetical protein DRQ61_02960 [Gammaproteobacteria bacterium]
MKQLLSILLFMFVFSSHAAEPKDAQQLVKSVSDKILQEISESRTLYAESDKALHGLVANVILPHFDFHKMAKIVMARSWKGMTEAQQVSFEREFRQLMVRIYAKALLEYDGKEVQFLPIRVNTNRDKVIVRTKISQSGRSGHGGRDGRGEFLMAYYLYLNEGFWKVFDIRVEGISLLKSYRDRFSRQARAEGVDAVINDLVEKNRKADDRQEEVSAANESG